MIGRKITNISNRMKPMTKKILLSVIVLVLFLLIGGNKSGFDVDEVMTFGLANHQYNGSLYPAIVQNQIYSGTEIFSEFVTVSSEHRFDYENVWVNQAADVHPPLYYAIIHTICSFFPETFGMWMGLVVNVIFAIIAFWQLVWLFKYFTHKEKMSVLFAILFVFGMGFINNLVFFRMYMMLTVWTNALLILFLKEDARAKGSWRFYLAFVGCIWGGLMTQYYFSIFCFFLCLTYACYVIKARNWKKFILCTVSAILGVGLSYVTFPSMIKHIFSGYRGRQAFENLSDGSFWEPLWEYLKILMEHVFGGGYVLIAILISLCILYLVKVKKIQLNTATISKYILMLVPLIGYVVVVAKISPFNTARYVMCIMGILYVSVFSLLIYISSYYPGNAVRIGVLFLAIIVLIGSYQDGVPHMYIKERSNIAMIEERKDSLCLYVYVSGSSLFKILYNLLEIATVNQVLYVKYESISEMNWEYVQNSENLLLYITNDVDEEEIFQILSEVNPSLDTTTYLFNFGYASVYYLE